MQIVGVSCSQVGFAADVGKQVSQAGRLLIVVVALMSWPAVTAAAHPACMTPEAQSLFDQELSTPITVSSRRFSYRDRPLQWIAVSHGWPLEGTVFVVDCGGRALARIDIGSPANLKLGPIVDGNPTLELSYIPATGTDMLASGAALIRFDGSSISELWTHDTRDNSWPPPYLGPKELDVWHWRFRSGYDHIDVSGTATYGVTKRSTYALPIERYCYRRSAGKFPPSANDASLRAGKGLVCRSVEQKHELRRRPRG